MGRPRHLEPGGWDSAIGSETWARGCPASLLENAVMPDKPPPDAIPVPGRPETPHAASFHDDPPSPKDLAGRERGEPAS
jgi:hypothetical protein